MKVLDEYVFFANDHQWAGNPYILRHSTKKLILGFRLAAISKLGQDWDSRFRPVYITGNTPEELAERRPRCLVDRPGPISVAFFELPDGSLLSWHNEWKEYWHNTLEGEQARNDLANLPFIKIHGPDPRQAGLDAEGVNPSFGVLQPIRVYHSDDVGETWREWGAIYADNDRKRGGCGFRGNMLQLDASTIAIALNDGRMVVSTDEGRNWRDRGRFGPVHNETSLYRKPDGELVAFIRSSIRDTPTLHLSRSSDEGHTWSVTENTDIEGWNPFHVQIHSSGRVLLIWGRRHNPRGIMAKILNPDLSDLLSAPEIWIDEYREPTSSGGYPCSVELDDGSCLVAYFACRKPYGIYEIHGRRIVLP